MKLSAALAAGLTFLRSSQRPDGSFEALVSPAADSFQGARQQPTVFHTMLLLDCLHDVPGAAPLCNQAADYTRQQMGAQGSWNYWETSSHQRITEPYPDDFDDTACALAALTRHDPAAVAGSQLGQFARLLIASEQAVAGPYNTWLIDWQASPQWHHVDLAVNANIGYALALHGATVSGLMSYIDTKLLADDLSSAYYVGPLPVLYFLARWYRGDQLAILRSRVRQAMRQSAPLPALQQALLLASAVWLDVPMKDCTKLAQRLLSSCDDGRWPATALYPEPPYGGRPHYAGSVALTTGFALQALSLYQRRLTTPAIAEPSIIAPRSVAPIVGGLPGKLAKTPLNRQYQAALREITAGGHGGQIAEAASLVARACPTQIEPTTITHLNLASLNGWLAYTIYDDFLDDIGRPAQLSIANVAHRQSYEHFMQALPKNLAFKQLVRQTFDVMDNANHWELRQARARVLGGTLRVTQLPDYADLHQLAERSYGHSLAATGVLTALFGSLDHPCVAAMQRFFEHFLIARQLHDDAHDWQADLQVGHLSAVVTLLLRSAPGELAMATDLERLQQRFWRYTIDEVADLMRAQFAVGRQELQACESYIDTTVFEGWLQALDHGLSLALAGRDQALQFIRGFEASYA